jgi:hypothetical protein
MAGMVAFEEDGRILMKLQWFSAAGPCDTVEYQVLPMRHVFLFKTDFKRKEDVVIFAETRRSIRSQWTIAWIRKHATVLSKSFVLFPVPDNKLCTASSVPKCPLAFPGQQQGTAPLIRSGRTSPLGILFSI